MLENYLIIHKSILPEYYEKVVLAKRLLERGEVREVSQAAKLAGISRSTYYKYKDYILEPSEMGETRKGVFNMMLSHEHGVLSALLSVISGAGGSIITISQSPPVRGRAELTVTVDISGIASSLDEFVRQMGGVPGVENVKLAAVE